MAKSAKKSSETQPAKKRAKTQPAKKPAKTQPAKKQTIPQEEILEEPAFTPVAQKDKKMQHIEGIKKTSIASVLGIFGGLIAYYLNLQSAILLGALLLVVLVYAQRYVLSFIGVSSKEFQYKDWFYLGFMTFAFLFVSWTLLLNQ